MIRVAPKTHDTTATRTFDSQRALTVWRPGQDAKPQQNVPSRTPRRGLLSDKPLDLHANTRTASQHIQALHSPKPIAPCKYLRDLSSALPSESRAPMKRLKPNFAPQAPRTWIVLEVSKNTRPGLQRSAKRPRHDGATHIVCGPVVSPIATSAAALTPMAHYTTPRPSHKSLTLAYRAA